MSLILGRSSLRSIPTTLFVVLSLAFVGCTLISASNSTLPPYAFPYRFAAHVKISFGNVQILANTFADFTVSNNQQKHVLEYGIINGTQFQLAHTTVWTNSSTGCSWDRDLYDLLCVGAFVCQCGPASQFPVLPQYPVGPNPESDGFVNFEGQRCAVYSNSSTEISYLINAFTGAPVAIIAAYGTNDQTIYEYLNYGEQFSDASLHHRCINVDYRRRSTDSSPLQYPTLQKYQDLTTRAFIQAMNKLFPSSATN